MDTKQLRSENAALRVEIERLTEKTKWATGFGIRLSEENALLRKELGILKAEVEYKKHIAAIKEMEAHKEQP